ncbi:hypothetical protein V2J09_006098 [Rumex salicifolius]
MCSSPSVFVPSTPEYIEIYDRFKVGKYWQLCLDEVARISAFVGAIIPCGMDSNPIVTGALNRCGFIPPPTNALLRLSSNMPRPSSPFLQMGKNDNLKSPVVIVSCFSLSNINAYCV